MDLVPQKNEVGMPTAQELMVYNTWAKTAVESQMYRGVGREAGVMMIMLAAREYGIGPAQALNGGLHIIEGKVELSARIMSALIRRAKHKLDILESTDQVCTIKGTRCDTGETHTVSYTIEMAQKAGLIKDKGGWKRTPEDMLYARSVSRLARQLFSDVVGIGYVEGEICDSRASGEVLEGVAVNTSINIGSLLQHFEESDHEMVKEFCKQVGEHYKWAEQETMRRFLDDIESVKLNFEKWKSKRDNGKGNDVSSADASS